MPENNVQKILTEAFRQASGSDVRPPDLTNLVSEFLPRSLEGLSGALTDVSKQLDNVRTASQTQSETTGANTQAVLQNTVAQNNGGAKGAIGTVAKTASGLFGSGLVLGPVFSVLGKLFGGGKTEAPPPLVKFSTPPPIRFEAANPSLFNERTGYGAIDYGQDGQPRRVQQNVRASDIGADPTASRPPAAPATSVNIHVQAMDSRSFMDHSHEIARAVRDAMLNMHSLNDVVSDL